MFGSVLMLGHAVELCRHSSTPGPVHSLETDLSLYRASCMVWGGYRYSRTDLETQVRGAVMFGSVLILGHAVELCRHSSTPGPVHSLGTDQSLYRASCMM
jgi:hypothetical protein